MVSKNMTGVRLADLEFTVIGEKVEEFANAICDPNPIYIDRAYARRKGFNDVLILGHVADELSKEGKLGEG